MEDQSFETKLKRYFEDGVEAFLPQVSINCVVFKFEYPHLKVLFHHLEEFDQWLLPGGYVRNEESLEGAAYRNLKHSGIEKVFLRQIQTFGEVQRIPKLSDINYTFSPDMKDIIEWTTRRFITVVYYGLIVESTQVSSTEGLFKDVNWFDVDQLDKIGLDHANITLETRKILATEIFNQPVASSLMKEQFTLNELRGLFEAILNRKIDRGTFRRKMLKLGIVELVDERKDSVGRPSHLYNFNKEAYHHLLKEESKFGF